MRSDGDHAGHTEPTTFTDLPVLLIDAFKHDAPCSAEEGQAMTEAAVAILVSFLRELDTLALTTSYE